MLGLKVYHFTENSPLSFSVSKQVSLSRFQRVNLNKSICRMHVCMPVCMRILYIYIYFWSLMKIYALICLFRDNLSSWGQLIEMRVEIIPKPSSDSGQSVLWNIKLSNKFHNIGRYCTSCLKRYTSVSVFQLSRPVQVKLRDRWDHSRVLVFILQDTDRTRNYTKVYTANHA